MTTESPDADFQLLHTLPPELLLAALSKFCDGKSLSTLALALTTSPDDTFCQQTAWYRIPMIVQRKLSNIASLLEDNGLPDDVANTAGVASWIASIASSTAIICDTSVSRQERLKLLSENLLVLDFLQESLNLYSNIERGQFEWPVWCGQVTVESTVDETRMYNTAAVVLTAPMQYPFFLPGAVNILRNVIPAASFRCEPQNRRPIPPWGRVRPLSNDSSVLAPVTARLEQWDHVATPMNTRYTLDTLNIAILSNKQARLRIADLPWTQKKSSWIVGNEEGLMFCWHDSVDVMTSRSYISFIFNLMKIRDRLEALEALNVS